MSRAYIGLGSNVGDRLSHLRDALADIMAIDHLFVVGKSSVYESEPVGLTDQEDFLNAVVEVETTRSPEELLHLLQEIEQRYGRRRITRWGPRTVDLDIILYDDLKQDDPVLTIPHPRLAERRFVMEPMLEIDPDVRLPDGTPVSRLLDALGDHQAVWRAGEL